MTTPHKDGRLVVALEFVSVDTGLVVDRMEMSSETRELSRRLERIETAVIYKMRDDLFLREVFA